MKPELRSIACVMCGGYSEPGNKYCKPCRKVVVSQAYATGKVIQVPKVFNDQRGRKDGQTSRHISDIPDMDRDGMSSNE